METFKFVVKEIREKTVYIYANNCNEAYEEVNEQAEDGEIEFGLPDIAINYKGKVGD